MELMSSLLLCALVALLPQTLGESNEKREADLKFNKTLLLQQIPIVHKKTLLNVNAPPLVSSFSELQVIFNDVKCKNCINCMERAMKAQKIQNHMLNHRPNPVELYNDVLLGKYVSYHRDERNIDSVDDTKAKKPKSKKNKAHRSVTVTKYNTGDEVYALKVNEMSAGQEQGSAPANTCQVYSVKKSFPCDSPDGNAILTAAKRQASKKGKKGKDKNKSTTSTTEKAALSVPSIFRKRHVDNSQVPEYVMPSIEELY